MMLKIQYCVSISQYYGFYYVFDQISAGKHFFKNKKSYLKRLNDIVWDMGEFRF